MTETPAPRPPGRSARRALASLRFLAYAAACVLGIAQLTGHDGASGAARRTPAPLTERGVPEGSYMDYALPGRTAQGRSLSLYVSSAGARSIRFTWLAHCPNGEVRGPFDLELLGFEYAGPRFSLSWVYHDHYRDGTTTRLDVHLAGRLLRRGQSAAGLVRIMDRVKHRGAAPMACGPGDVRWSAARVGSRDP